jgi:diguanylate cyclase (GGDEF)-like protein/PAS domain S-box-containing protein
MREEREREAERDQQARTNRILESIRKVHRMTIERNEPGPVFDLLLSEVLDATDSEYGFLGEVQRGADGLPFLRLRALTDLGGSGEARRSFERRAPDGLELHDLCTLLGAVLTDGQPLIANDPANHPRPGGLPAGHPPLGSFLGLPLTDGDGMVGLLGLANRPGGYDRELVEYLEPLMATSARLLRAFEQERRRRDAEHELRLSEERWKRSVELAVHPVLLWDRERTLTYANRAALELLDSRYESIVGRSLDDLIVEPDLDHEASLRRFRENGWSHRITFLRTPSGEDRPVDLQAVDLGNGTSQAIALDMREWVEIGARLEAATQRDNLTGLLNRRAIEEHAEVEIQRSRRRATHVALVLVDVDYFKRINDAWGHLTGDIALRQVAETLSRSVRPRDRVGRWGGEEFLVVLPEATEEQAHLIAERIRNNVASQGLKSAATGVIPLTASLGVTAVECGTTPGLRVLFERVDRALYAAKEMGRNRTVIWSEDLRAA